jgi:3-oxoadipate enol-lactonase
VNVLLLHAGIADRRMWAPQIEALEAAGHRVVAPDLPGFGDAALEPPTVDYVAFSAELLDEPAAVVGCSFGGRVALELAALRPGLVRRLVLIAPGLASTEWSEETEAGFAEEERLVDTGDLAGAAEQQARMWLAPDTSDDVRALTADMTRLSYDRQLAVEGVRAVWPEHSAEELNRLLLDFLQ